MGDLKIIKASAGSGKTYRLTLEYIRYLIIAPENYRNILAVTFTNKATAEMKERILKELSALSNHKIGEHNSFYEEFLDDDRIDNSKIIHNAQKALQYILHDYTLFSVFTIDKFFQKILRSFVRELGLDGGYNIKFDNDYTTLLAIDRLLESSKHDTKLQLMIESMIGDNLSNQLSADVRINLKKLSSIIANENFVNSKQDKEPYFIEIEKLYKEILSDITNQAKIVANLVGTYNLTVEQLPGKSRSFMSDVRKIISGVISYGKTTLKTVNGESNWPKNIAFTIQEHIIGELIRLIEIIDSTETIRNTCYAVLKNYRSFLLLERINDEIINIGRENSSLMLSRSMTLLSDLINDNEVPFIYEKVGNSFSRFMIDEFQDTSTGQWKNFVPLINEALSKSEGNAVTLLGDVKQSIYGWRGGNWRLLGGDLIDDIKNKEQIAPLDTLTTNWRSQPNIIEFNNSFMTRFVELLSSDLNSQITTAYEEKFIDKPYYERNIDILKNAYSDLYQNISPKAIKDRGYVEIDYCDYKNDEHLKIMMRNIESAQERGFKASDIAILVRSKKEAQEIASFIINYRSKKELEMSNYCYDFVSQQALKLSSSNAVNLIITAMKVSQFTNLKQGDAQSLMFNSLYSGTYEAELSNENIIFLESLKYLSLLEGFESIISFTKLDKNKDDLPYIQALHEKMIAFSSENSVDVVQFLEWWDNEGSETVIYMPQNENAMLIATVHLSKGLEFKIVILPFARQKLAPKPGTLLWVESDVKPFDLLGKTVVNYSTALSKSMFSKSYYDLLLLTHIESTNILYVALTRSCEELYMTLDNNNTNSDIYDSVIGSLCNEMTITLQDNNNIKSYVKGIKTSVLTNKNSDNTTVLLSDYKSIDYKNRLKIRTSTRRYYMDNDKDYLSPRHYGVIMHKLFERIDNNEEISSALEDMVREGIISNEDMMLTQVAIEKAFANPLISDWFHPRWKVRAENDILMPMTDNKNLVSFRPDRVLTFEGKAVVIDYKFGMKSNRHAKQISHYKLLLEQMGYTDVEGYIWYVLENEVTKT